MPTLSPVASLLRSRLCWAAAALVLLAGCRSTPEPDPVPAPPPGIAATWRLNLTAYRGQNNTRVIFECPSNPGRVDVGSVWGTDVYSDDSSVCLAAVHAGAATFERGGEVEVTILPGQGGYEPSTRNGVESSRWGAWSGSFSVAQRSL